MCECKTQLISVQDGLHDTVDIDLVPSDEGVAVGVRFVPLDSDVAEITCPGRQREIMEIVIRSSILKIILDTPLENPNIYASDFHV